MTTEEQSAADRPVKRKRVTVSCLACNRRKVKCDRTLPCNNCRARNESDMCEYMDGHVPAPPSEPVSFNPAATAEVEMLKNRMEQLESHIVRLVGLVDTKTPPSVSPHRCSSLSTGTYSTPFSNHTTATPALAPPKSTSLDRTFLALDDLSRGYTESPGSTPRNETPNSQVNRTDISRTPEAWPSIFLLTNDNVSSPRYTQVIYDIVSALPKDDMLTVLVDHHFTNNGVFWHFVQENVFKVELSQFISIRFTPNVILVDPAWLTLLISILRLAIHSLLSEDTLATALLVGNKSTLQPMDILLTDAFELALYGAKVLNKPQVRVLQALLLAVSQQHLGKFMGLIPDKGTLWHDVAISTCKHLRLNVVTESLPDQDLPVDPAFPPSSPLYAREWSSRLSHSLLFMDEIAEAIETDRRGESNYSIRILESEITTPPPRNFRDEDLWSEVAETKQTEPHPSFVLTEIAWQIHGFRTAHYWKVISQLIRDPLALTPDIVRSLDIELRQGDYELVNFRTNYQLNRVQDILCESFHGSYQQRVLRLHRHYFLRSYSDPSLNFSQSAALSAARAIIKGHKEIVLRHDIYNPRFLTLVFFSHHVTAAILLFIHGCLKPSARQGIQKELRSSLDLFEESRPPNANDDREFWHLSVSRGRRFIQAMFKGITENPPSDLPGIESFMMDLNRRGLDTPDTSAVPPPTANELQQFAMPYGAIDTTMEGFGQNDAMLPELPTQLDWDSLFMGF